MEAFALGPRECLVAYFLTSTAAKKQQPACIRRNLRNRILGNRTDWLAAKGRGWRMECEVGVSRCKLIYRE